MSANVKITWNRPSHLKAQRVGLGDVVSKIATPIAVAVGLPCINKETNQLNPGSPCDKRKKALNDFSNSVVDSIQKLIS